MQLFTHLLSSYLQGMGDFFSALPRGGLGRGLFPHHIPWGGLEWGLRMVGEGLEAYLMVLMLH